VIACLLRIIVRRCSQMKRREFLELSFRSAAVAALSSARGRCEREGNSYRLPEERRAGHRATAGNLEDHFKPAGIEVKWVEFSSGPPMMEAMNVGSIDYGAVGRPAAGVRAGCGRGDRTRPASPSPTARASWCRKIRRSAPSPI
jgi:ABC-type nitrate/sulfonate/bicarbonate transport system substrate-binding protein